MEGSRRLALGLFFLVGGLALLGIDSLVGSGVFDVVGLVLLLLVPQVIALGGAVILILTLAKGRADESRSQTFGRIVAVPVVAGVGLALAVLLVGTVMLVPDWAQGYTGMFGAGFGVGLGAVVEVGLGFLVGGVVGLVAALVWWVVRGRSLPPSPPHEDPPSAYPIPPIK